MNASAPVLFNSTPSTEWFEAASPQDILRWAMQTYGERLTMATAFGAEGCLLIDMMAQLRDELGFFPDVFNLDTGYQFGQTLTLKKQLEKRYDIEIRVVTPDPRVEEAEKRSREEHNLPLHKTDPNLCCFFRKVAPLPAAVEGYDAWITSIRRDQTPERAATPIVGPDSKLDLVKINPLANWNSKQVWDYIREHNVPVNPLHAQGFPSIGCYPCTKPVAEGEDERAGRWAGSEKRECGLHIATDAQTLRRSQDATVEAAVRL